MDPIYCSFNNLTCVGKLDRHMHEVATEADETESHFRMIDKKTRNPCDDLWYASTNPQ